jgi:hypothetical protein
VRLPAILLVASLLGVLAGAALIAKWAAGCAVIFDSLCVGAWAIWGYDDGKPAVPQVREVPGTTLEAIFDRARAS